MSVGLLSISAEFMRDEMEKNSRFFDKPIDGEINNNATVAEMKMTNRVSLFCCKPTFREFNSKKIMNGIRRTTDTGAY